MRVCVCLSVLWGPRKVLGLWESVRGEGGGAAELRWSVSCSGECGRGEGEGRGGKGGGERKRRGGKGEEEGEGREGGEIGEGGGGRA